MSNLSGISEYLNLAEVKESVREGADSVKKLMKEPSGLTKTEMSLLLAVFLMAGVITVSYTHLWHFQLPLELQRPVYPDLLPAFPCALGNYQTAE